MTKLEVEEALATAREKIVKLQDEVDVVARNLSDAENEIIKLRGESKIVPLPFGLPEGEITFAALIAFRRKPDGKMKLETTLFPGPAEGFKGWAQGNTIKAMLGNLSMTHRNRGMVMKRYLADIKEKEGAIPNG